MAGARLYLGAIFVIACWHKLRDPSAFALDIATYQILPLAVVNPMAIVLPWVEMVAGLMLIVGFRTRAAALLIAAMMVVFTVAIAVPFQVRHGARPALLGTRRLLDDQPVSRRLGEER